jgi:cytochrome c oxidase subunit IV
VKALLVVAIFMHLKWDWGRLYFMIIPAMILAPMLVFALLPDIVLYWKHVSGWNVPQ